MAARGGHYGGSQVVEFHGGVGGFCWGFWLGSVFYEVET